MKVKILFVGDGSYSFYARALYEASKRDEKIYADFFDYNKLNICDIRHENYIRRFEYHYCTGPDVYALNHSLANLVKKEKYDIVFLYSAVLIYPDTVKKMKKYGSYVAMYHNDNPFSENAEKYRYRHFIKSIKNADVVYAYRKSNLKDYLQCGAKCTKLLRSYYIKTANFYVPESDRKSLEVPSICFIGHYEKDGRLDYIKALTEKGIDVGIISGWPNIGEHAIILDNTVADYNMLLNLSKIAIVFLSKINKDTYTRRCFEIPMTKTMMLAQYTEDLSELFEEDKEIVFFRNVDEFVSKALYYLQHDDERKKIAENGYSRCLHDGNEALDRVNEIVEEYKKAIK